MKVASRDLKLCVPELQEKVPLIIAEYNAAFPERELRVICTLRSTLEQQALYALGRTVAPIGKKYRVTQLDGLNCLGKHNPWPNQPLSQAIDVGVFISGKYIVNATFYYPLVELCRKYVLRSGMDFGDTGKSLKELLLDKQFHDLPHIEVHGPLNYKV